jgi:hypothetical protein
MVFVANLSSEQISSVEEFDAIYKCVPCLPNCSCFLFVELFPSQATKNRSVGATYLNRASSRSHAVLTIEVRMVDPVENKSSENTCLSSFAELTSVQLLQGKSTLSISLVPRTTRSVMCIPTMAERCSTNLYPAHWQRRLPYG